MDSPIKIRQDIYLKIADLVYSLNGIVFGGFVRDYYIRAIHAKKNFMEYHKNMDEEKVQKLFWDEEYFKSTIDRLNVPNDIDICFQNSRQSDIFIRRLSTWLNLKLESTHDIKNIYLNKSVKKLVCSIEHQGLKHKFCLDIVIDIELRPHFGNLDFISNIMIMKKNNMYISPACQKLISEDYFLRIPFCTERLRKIYDNQKFFDDFMDKQLYKNPDFCKRIIIDMIVNRENKVLAKRCKNFKETKILISRIKKAIFERNETFVNIDWGYKIDRPIDCTKCFICSLENCNYTVISPFTEFEDIEDTKEKKDFDKQCHEKCFWDLLERCNLSVMEKYNTKHCVITTGMIAEKIYIDFVFSQQD